MDLTVAPTGDADADGLVQTNPFALLFAMLLDQQISIELAFKGPARLQQRLGRPLSAAALATVDDDHMIELFSEKPALHRFPKNMAKRTVELVGHLNTEMDGDPARLWSDSPSADTLFGRLRALPGFGEEKAMILLAVLGKQSNFAPDGWETFAGPFADEQPRSVADIDSPEALARVKAWKKEQRAAGRTKQQ